MKNFIQILLILLSILILSSFAYSDEFENNAARDDSGKQVVRLSLEDVYQQSDLPLSAKTYFGELSSADQEFLAADQEPPAIGVVRALEKPINFNFNSNFLEQGHSTIVDHGKLEFIGNHMIWTTYLEAKDAEGIRIKITQSDLPAVASVYIYNDNGEVYGPYAASRIGEEGMWSHVLFSDHAYLQVQLPMDYPDYDSFNIGIEAFCHQVYSYQSRTGCFEDVNCTAANNFSNIEILKSACAHLQYVDNGGSYICSGSLINDTNEDHFMPYLLTANHCISSQTVAQSVVSFFDYETEYCGGPVGEMIQVLGAHLTATNAANDFTFLLLGENVPTGEDTRWYLGWTTASVSNGTSLYSVNHPAGMPQQYIKSANTTSGFNCSGFSYSNYHYTNPVQGATVGGSSGGTVTLENGQVVGQLYGSCGTNLDDECDYPAYNNMWGRFNVTYPHISNWLSGAAVANILVSPSSLDFGTVAVGQSAYQEITITNTEPNGLNLDVNTLVMSFGIHYSIVGGYTYLYIPPGQSQTITIEYSPQNGQVHDEQLFLFSNASNINIFIQYITGIGEDPGNPLPPENLSAQIINGYSIYFDWLEPGQTLNENVSIKSGDPENGSRAGTLQGYNLYYAWDLYNPLNFDLISDSYYIFESGVHGYPFQYVVTAIYDDGESLPSNVVEIEIPCMPTTAWAGEDIEICESEVFVQLNGAAENYQYVQWFTFGDGYFDDPYSLTPIYYPGSEDYQASSIFICMEAYGQGFCENGWDCMLLYFAGVPELDLSACGYDFTICDGEAFYYDLDCIDGYNYDNLNWSTTEGTGYFEYSESEVIYYPSEADYLSGYVEIIIEATPWAPCSYSNFAYLNLYFEEVPEINAGFDVTLEEGVDYVNLDGQIDGDYYSFNWYTSGTGYFSDYTVLYPSYYLSDDDMASGTVDLCLEVNSINSCYSQISDCMTVTIPLFQTIILNEGWNQLSSFINPTDSNIENMLAQISDELIIINNLTGANWPLGGINTLGDWDIHSGYQIKLSQNSSLTIGGNVIEDLTLNLVEGWNLVPVLSESDVLISDLFSGQLEKVVLVKDAIGTEIFWPAKGIETLQFVKPGNAYLVRMNEPVQISY